ncbi:hypothetical protein [Ralstonia pickettii]|uniref:hypothetical protein n=1 Tax=Ralstonia pickettii TaxID=329 RepID=UPI0015FCE9BF|nr:hypothetical protein [Ralstonia pickettii]MBB0025521.1 hypothetical protein [Ralstonia pickettii]MBB0036149.1 hypothetical protein [Ralstonia pickettii]MBB0098849.1 hypothetical protein [Ralstonia pickettii]MBB0108794.1 hypothetical protein [Ralstonia pickettii]MBB0129623.1 hypothetical protein [Ralstonia pickettii]
MEKDVAKLPYLHQTKDRNGWLLRVSIPKRLRPFAKQREFKRALGPTYQEALQRYPAMLHEWATLRTQLEDQALQSGAPLDANYQPPVTYKTLTLRERKLLDHFVASWEHCALDAHDDAARDLDDDELDAHENDLKERQAALQASLRRLSPPDWWIEEMEGNLEEAMAVRLHPDCPERKDFFLRLLGAELKALRASLDRLAGTAYIPTPPKPSEPIEDEAAQDKTHTLLKAFDTWANQRTRSGGEKTVNEYRAYAESFAQFALQVPLAQASLAAVAARKGVGRAWLEHIAKERGVQRTTLKKYRSALGTLFGVATDHGWVSTNPFAFRLGGLQLRGTKAEQTKSNKDKRAPFTQADLDRYFTGPLFDGPGFDKRLAPAVAYWFPLLLRFTGARPLEIAHLMPDDIVLADDEVAAQLAGHNGASWIYIFSDVHGVDGVIRPLKTGVSMRRFPIPKILLDLGFAEYVHSVPRGQWLLPMQVSSRTPENRARYALTALGDYLRTTLGIMDQQLVTYSFRHTVIDEAREAGIQKEVRDNLVGHTEGDHRAKNAGETYYGARWYPATPLLEAVTQLDGLHRLPPTFPTWTEYQQRKADFSQVSRAAKALPSKRGNRTPP